MPNPPTSKEIEQLRDALLDAYSYSELQQMVLLQLGAELSHLVPVVGRNMTQIVYDLVRACAAQPGGFAGLARAGLNGNPQNPALQAAAAAFHERKFAVLPLPAELLSRASTITATIGDNVQNVAIGEHIIQIIYNFPAPPAPPVESGRLSDEHAAYLRHWFGKPWTRIRLADILEDSSGEVSLLDVYVPLQVDCKIRITVADHQITDWAVVRSQERDLAQERRLALKADQLSEEIDEITTEKLRAWTDLGVGEEELQKIVNGAQAKIRLRNDNGEKTEDGEHTWFMEAHDAVSVQARFVLLGDPGSGKSSFVRHLTLCLAGQLLADVGETAPPKANLATLRDWLLGAYTPIFIELRDLVRSVFPPLPSDREQPAARPGSAEFWRYVHTAILSESSQDFESELKKLCASGEAILLLDGLDEVGEATDPRRRDQIKTLIYTLGETYPKLRIIVTSRPNAYRGGEWTLDGFGRTRLDALSLNRLQELANALFGRMLGEAGGQEAKTFVEAVRHDQNLRWEPGLYANPLFFTMLASLWLSSPVGARMLPSSKAELYRRSVDLMLGRWIRHRASDAAAGQTDQAAGGFDETQLRSALETLACTVHSTALPQQDTTEFHGKELLGVLLDAGLLTGMDEVLPFLERKAGILISSRPAYFSFIHRSFQEHLAACELTCREPEMHVPPVAEDRRFPAGLLTRLTAEPGLWENVARRAADELVSASRVKDLWLLLTRMCEPYWKRREAATTALLALELTLDNKLFETTSPARRLSDGETDTLFEMDPDEVGTAQYRGFIKMAAERILTDTDRFTPPQRDIAGRLLGGGPFPGHDTRPGVGVVPTGAGGYLPAMDWVEIPATDAEGKADFIYQEDERRQEPRFWMARYPVTYAQFQIFLDDPDGFDNPHWWEGLAADADDKRRPDAQSFAFWNHPRDTISWYHSLAFCRWLTVRLQDRRDLLPPGFSADDEWYVDLPTERQWEKAARGFTGLLYPWGDEYLSGYANIDERSSKVGDFYLQKTSAVGMYPQGQSPFGIADLSGNVWEWCRN
ncbi:MAG: SUMF1/EgtB/PvdO family nonheme iron enzyme, partial [Caldilineaceae bacterium]|nr:SUMF1/EgtB/PvdO family nonheme iron enzyme [Caldilineaceae bacterium]